MSHKCLCHCTAACHKGATVSIFMSLFKQPITAVRLVYNPFSQFGPQLELYPQLQLSLWSDPIALGVPIRLNST